MSLSQYDPLANFPATFRGFEDAIARMLNEPRGTRPWTPSVDIFETENEIVVKAELPGVDRKDITLNLENNVLTVKGERKFEKETKEENYHRIEREYGSFSRSFALPTAVNGDTVKAEYKDGVLRIILPKR